MRSWDGLPGHLLARIFSKTCLPSDQSPQTAIRLVCHAWRNAFDAHNTSLSLARWPRGLEDANGAIAPVICHVCELDTRRLDPEGDACPSLLHDPAEEGNGGDAAGHHQGAQLEATSSCNSSCTLKRRTGSWGSHLDLTGAAVLQPRVQAAPAAAAAGMDVDAGQAAGDVAALPAQQPTGASLLCYLASMWPEALPLVPPAAFWRLWKALPRLPNLQALYVSGAMLQITGVQTAVAGCPDAAAALGQLQQLHAAGLSDAAADLSGTAAASCVVTHKYTLQAPPALGHLTRLRCLSIEWQLQRPSEGEPNSGSSGSLQGIPVRRRSYEGSGSSSPFTQHTADPAVHLPPEFSQLVALQQLELAGDITSSSTLLPLIGLQQLQQLVLGPGKLATQALVPCAAAGVLGGLTGLVLRQKAAWEVPSVRAVLAAATRLQRLEVQELEMASAELSAAGPLQQVLTAADMRPVGSSLTHLLWCTCRQRLAAGASLLCHSPAAAAAAAAGALDAELFETAPGNPLAAAAGPWLRGLPGLQSIQLRGLVRGSSVLGAPALEALSRSIGSCSKLEQLCITALGMPLLPDSLSQLRHLRVLRLEACGATRMLVQGTEALLAVVGRCSSLQDLALTGCELRALPHWLPQLRQLTRLQCNSNYLQELHAAQHCAGLPSGLQHLDLADNRLRELPTSLAQLSRLTQLVLDSNYLTTLPGSIWDLPALQLLSVQENMLAALPECVKTPAAAVTALSAAPDAPFCCCNSSSGRRSNCGSSLCCSCSQGHSLSGVQAALPAAHAAPAAASVQAVGPAATGGYSRHAAVYGFAGLSPEEEELLEAVGCSYSTSSVSAWASDTSTCRDQVAAAAAAAGAAVVMTSMPSSSKHWRAPQWPGTHASGARQLAVSACAGSLRSLLLADNQLTALPRSIGQLSSLRELDLSRNQLRSLPDKCGLWALSGLTQLQLAGNHLCKLPAGLVRLQRLQQLDMSGNHLHVTLAAAEHGSSAAIATAAALAAGVPAGMAAMCTSPTAAAATAAAAAAAAVLGTYRRRSSDTGTSDQGMHAASSSSAAAAVAAGSNRQAGSNSSSSIRPCSSFATARHSAAVVARAPAPVAPSTRDMVTVVLDTAEGAPAAAYNGKGSSSGGSSSRCCVKKAPTALPVPLGRLPQLQRVGLQHQHPEGSSSWVGQRSLQLLLDGLFDLAQCVRHLTPPKHQCPVAKAAAAAVAHLTGVTSGMRAKILPEQMLLDALGLEPSWAPAEVEQPSTDKAQATEPAASP